MPARLYCQNYQEDRIPDAFRFVILYSDNKTRTEDDSVEVEYTIVKECFFVVVMRTLTSWWVTG
jgi:hypothetical protein